MELGVWRVGGRKPWTMPDLRRLRKLVDAGMGPPAIWPSGKLPNPSESAIAPR